MKTIKYLTLTLLGVFLLAVSCKDDKELIPVWESGINGEGTVTGATDIKKGDGSVIMNFDLKWISVDGAASVTKIEVFLTFKENYQDVDNNPAVADHGTVPLMTFEGSAVPGNRTPVSFSLSQAEVLALYSGITYDYKDGVDGNAVDVFANPYNPERSTISFLETDKFTVTWQFTGSDGRVFKAWSPSVCTEFPDSNCQLDFGVVCASDITNPGANGGAWTIDMADSYGDGWQGGYISAKIDGAETKVFIPSGAGNAALTTVLNVPPTAVTLTFDWVKGNFDSEDSFKITSPKGNVVANVNGPTAGPIKLNLCKE